MMVNLSPTVDSHHETLCSLRFAERVNQCQLGRPERRMQSLASDGEGGGAGKSKGKGKAEPASASASGSGPAAADGGETGASKDGQAQTQAQAQGTKRSARPTTGPAAKRAVTKRGRRP